MGIYGQSYNRDDEGKLSTVATYSSPIRKQTRNTSTGDDGDAGEVA